MRKTFLIGRTRGHRTKQMGEFLPRKKIKFTDQRVFQKVYSQSYVAIIQIKNKTLQAS